MSKIARVKFIRDKEPNIKALTASGKVLDGALYIATDTGTMWMGVSATSLLQIKDNINTNTTYTLTKNGNTITLKGSDGSSVNVTDSNTIYNNATASADGLMSAADKSKLDSVATGANKTVVDSSFVTNSTNPVQSKVVKSALDGKSDTGHKHVKADITDFPTSMPASDVSAWAKAATKPSYSKAEVGLGNVDNTADSTKSVKYAASSNYANSAGKANGIVISDTRNENPAPSSAAFDKRLLTADFKVNDKINSPTGFSGTYCGVLSFAPWSETSGGHGYQLAFGYASEGHPRLALRGSDLSASSWNRWYKVYTSDDKPTLSELGAAAASHTHSKSQITDFPSSMPASDVYAWAKASSKPSYSWSEISNKPTIPSVGNGTITITQNGATKGSFTLNQSGNATIALTDNDTKYSLPAATSSTLGGVKVGSNITNNSGTISLTKANVTAALGYTPPTSDTNTWRPEEVIISSTQPSASTCKLWIKI